jgi:hypothetical protein
MSIARFRRYALTFEKAYRSDDWSLLDPFFAADAVYKTIAPPPPFADKHQGGAEVVKSLEHSVANFDRRFDSRKIELLEGPEEREGAIWILWRVTYRLAGAPDLVIEGEERAWFKDDRIKRLEDRFPPGVAEHVTTYLEEHGARLGITG